MYHLPPNNAIGALTDLNRNDDIRAAVHELDVRLQNRDPNTENAGQGPSPANAT